MFYNFSLQKNFFNTAVNVFTYIFLFLGSIVLKRVQSLRKLAKWLTDAMTPPPYVSFLISCIEIRCSFGDLPNGVENIYSSIIISPKTNVFKFFVLSIVFLSFSKFVFFLILTNIFLYSHLIHQKIY